MKPLRVGVRMGERNFDLVLGLENVWEPGGVLKLEIGSEVEVEVQLELATAVSLVALAPVHLLVDPGEVEPEIVELHADCLEGSDGELGGFQYPPSEAHDLAWALLEGPERCCH